MPDYAFIGNTSLNSEPEIISPVDDVPAIESPTAIPFESHSEIEANSDPNLITTTAEVHRNDDFLQRQKEDVFSGKNSEQIAFNFDNDVIPDLDDDVQRPSSNITPNDHQNEENTPTKLFDKISPVPEITKKKALAVDKNSRL